ncbi:ATP phosphoribosyltransferase regulatory subunit [Salaquimonas pukyongi]|uniref:ATP phosphoribosyltransferase regulatory subunit n=1 Tax=Salaquimonas pukyongi TaxID=2712698 RepID=UPI00096B8983|nr:ATP phosphoribosyltransferase regulatory subunit [Salaquimonas pukyongi]
MTALSQRIESFLREKKCALPEIGLLQPAEPILNTAGEDIRRRIFITADQRGRDLCLRPEFTIPVCLSHLESGKARKRYGYVGKVFRQRADEPAEFLQAGIEDIGTEKKGAADVRCLADCIDLLRMLGRNRLSVAVGDQAIFEAVLKSLGLPKAWRERLGRNFGDSTRLTADLDRLSGKNNGSLDHLAPELARAVEAGDREAVEKAIARDMKKAGLPPQSGRTAEEIAARLMEKAALAAAHLVPEKREVLEAFLDLDMPLKDANRRLWSFARRANIPLGKALEAFHKRAVALEKLDLDNVSLRYRAGFGRTLDYYTGFVFEVRGGSSDAKPLAGGGRYDRLMTVLGSRQKMPATGFAVYVDRVKPKLKETPGTMEARP